MTERAPEGERRLRFTPDHPKRRTEDQVLLGIKNYIETAVEDPRAFQYDDGSPTLGIAMIRNEQGAIVAHATRMRGTTMIHTVGEGIDEMILVYSDRKEPSIDGLQRWEGGLQRMTTFTPTLHRREYSSRLSALALGIGALRLTIPQQPRQPAGGRKR